MLFITVFRNHVLLNLYEGGGVTPSKINFIEPQLCNTTNHPKQSPFKEELYINYTLSFFVYLYLIRNISKKR